jgi:hypothetical protein
VNIRSLTRGDGAVIGAAVLLLIASFLTFYGVEGCTVGECGVSAWKTEFFPLLPSVHLLGLIAAGLTVASRFQPEGRKVFGIGLNQWGAVLAFAAAWDALWALFNGSNGLELGVGAYLSFLAAAALAAVSVLSLTGLAAFKAPLLPAPRPQPQPQPGMYGQQPYPGMGGPQPQQPGGYGYPAPGGQDLSNGGQPQPHPYGAPAPQPQPQPMQAGPAAPEFAAFWFAVPVARPLFAEDGSPSPIAELAPGTWYLAVDQRGPALIAQTQDGRRGVLQDTSGIQRG